MTVSGFEAQGAGAAVQITLGQVFNEVRAMHDELKGISSKLEPISSQLVDHEGRLREVDGVPDDIRGLQTQQQDHETRIRLLERRGALLLGGVLVVGSSAGSLLTWALTRH